MESGKRERKKTHRGALSQSEGIVKRLCLLLLSVTLMVSGPSFAQEVSEEEIERYEEIKKAAKDEKIEEAVQEDQTGTDPRVFNNKWMPFYRYTELENGLTQQDLTAFGTIGFSPRVGMFYELPLAQYRDFSDVPGLPPGADSDAIGMGDIDLKFLIRPKALDFSFGKEGKKSGSVLLGTDFLLPTATDDALAGDAFLLSICLSMGSSPR